ncbi:sensor domain-containing protein [Vibrio salinus]|uniref:sensor domain-containing protein n=1 Tax=Vibrio salinus TaxID=2899784 RepID=UPI001E2D7EC7|nr:EAL domain-containing protein [Vibrio salinus]MCE0495646.1 EAL domain-containing protein [Vibrio salinus]
MAKQCDDKWANQRRQTIGLGERSVRKNYYPQLKRNVERIERFRALLEFTSDFVLLINIQNQEICDVNKATLTLLNLDEDTLVGKPIDVILEEHHNNVVQVVLSRLKNLLLETERDNVTCEVHYDEKDDLKDSGKFSRQWLELSSRQARVEGEYYMTVVGRNITDRKQHEEVLNSLIKEKEALLDNALVGLAWIKDRIIVSCNKKLEEMLGYREESIVGCSTRILYESDEAFNDFGQEAYQALASGKTYTGTIKLAKLGGEHMWCQLTGNAIDPSNPQNSSVWIFNDIHEHMLIEEKARFLSQHDTLTGLPNLRFLEDQLNHIINQCRKENKVATLLNLDLDRFKNVNDVIGYNCGNDLLKKVAKRLQKSVGEQGIVCRHSGDEFLVVLGCLTDKESCLPVLSQIFSIFREDFKIGGQELTLSCSLGISSFPHDGEDFETLLNKANIAMYQAKDAGRNTYCFFSSEMNKVAEETLMIAFGLHKALEFGQFQLHYQPQIDINTERLLGGEALIRWNHPEFGMISPNKFIPVAENTGMIIPIGEWVIQEACKEVKKWQKNGLINPVIAVNLSAIQFTHGDIEKTAYQAIKQADISPEMLELELTESIIIRDAENVLAKVKRLQLMGCKLSIDDFGTGYSSLAYLKRFAVDKLKIDQAFVRDLNENQDDAVIVRTIIQMAKNLGLKTIAEGIESKEILELLKLYRCDEAQGYYISKPMSGEAFIDYIHSCCTESK